MFCVPPMWNCAPGPPPVEGLSLVIKACTPLLVMPLNV